MLTKSFGFFRGRRRASSSCYPLRRDLEVNCIHTFSFIAFGVDSYEKRSSSRVEVVKGHLMLGYGWF